MMNFSGPFDQLPMNWVGDWSGRRAALTPSRAAIIDADAGIQWSYCELDQVANAVGGVLSAKGLGQGDVVGLVSGNNIESVLLFLACGKLGLIMAPVSHRLAPKEMGELFARIDAAVIYTTPEYAKPLEHAGLTETADLYELCQAGADNPDTPNCNRPLPLDSPCLYVHTGGSTGLPKICVVTHRQMIWNAIELLVSAPEGLSSRRELLLFPLFHIGGWNTLLPVLYGGGCVVMLKGFDPATVLATIARYQVDHFGAVEAMLKALVAADDFSGVDLRSVKGITTAGAACATSVMRPFFDRGIPVSQAYGLTEAGPSNCFHSPQDQSIPELMSQADTIGTGFYHCDHQLMDPATGKTVVQGEIGELWFRSPHNFSGYLDDPSANERIFSDEGWVRSGDLAWEDDQGRLRIVGRLDNVIVSGGENISAEEIEAVLVEHPAIDGAIVFGQPDPRWGETPIAQITVNQAISDQQIKAWLAQRLARFKHPKVIHIVKTLPLTGAGKLDRKAAKKQNKDAL